MLWLLQKKMSLMPPIVHATLCYSASLHLAIQRLWISKHTKDTTPILPDSDSDDKINECQSKGWPHSRRFTRSSEILIHPEV